MESQKAQLGKPDSRKAGKPESQKARKPEIQKVKKCFYYIYIYMHVVTDIYNYPRTAARCKKTLATLAEKRHAMRCAR